MTLVVLQFLACLGVILVAGSYLSNYADVIAEKSGLGRTWIGLILLATVTSLPELFSGVSAVVLKFPDIAVGSVLGSCVFNLALIVLVDFISPGESIYTRAGQGHILSASLGLTMIALIGFALLVAPIFDEPTLLQIGISSPIIIVFYLASARMLYNYEKRQPPSADAATQFGHISTRRAAYGFAAASVAVVAAAIVLPKIGNRMGELMGWNDSFVGTLFVAFATSAPELVVTIQATRSGAIDLAVGNVLGSNLFNIAMFGIFDPFYRNGSLLLGVSSSHTVTAFAGIVMSGLVIAGLFYRPGRRIFKTVGWVSLLLIALFLLNSLALYMSN